MSRTYARHKKLPGIYFDFSTNNIRSYSLWSPVIVKTYNKALRVAPLVTFPRAQLATACSVSLAQRSFARRDRCRFIPRELSFRTKIWRMVQGRCVVFCLAMLGQQTSTPWFIWDVFHSSENRLSAPQALAQCLLSGLGNDNAAHVGHKRRNRKGIRCARYDYVLQYVIYGQT